MIISAYNLISGAIIVFYLGYKLGHHIGSIDGHNKMLSEHYEIAMNAFNEWRHSIGMRDK